MNSRETKQAIQQSLLRRQVLATIEQDPTLLQMVRNRFGKLLPREVWVGVVMIANVPFIWVRRDEECLKKAIVSHLNETFKVHFLSIEEIMYDKYKADREGKLEEHFAHNVVIDIDKYDIP